MKGSQILRGSCEISCDGGRLIGRYFLLPTATFLAEAHHRHVHFTNSMDNTSQTFRIIEVKRRLNHLYQYVRPYRKMEENLYLDQHN